MMRLILFLISGLFISAASIAQVSSKHGELHSAPVIKNDLLSAERSDAQAEPIQRPVLNNARHGSTAVVIGNSANPFTGVGVRSPFQYVPELNTLALIHRQDPLITGVGASGWINFGYSSDGGLTWSTENGPLWDNTNGMNARYPQGFILNPPGNTDINNAHAVFMGPTLEGTNGTSWGGVGYASRTIGATGAATNQVLFNGAAGSRLQYIPDGGTVANNTIWVIDPIPDFTGAAGVYTDSLAIYKGNINAGQVDFTQERMHFPVNQDGGFPTSEAISFSPDGQTGYITMLGRLDSTINPFETYSLIWMKTTDAGATWSAPSTIDIVEDTVLINQLGGDTSFIVTTAFEQDMVVDKNGNPHCFMNIGLTNKTGAGYTIFGTSSIMYHVWSPDGGINWNIDSVAGTHGFRGHWGDLNNDITEDHRPQIARDTSGKYIMMAFFDADTTIFNITPCDPGSPPANAPCGNIDRTIKYIGYNVDKDYHTPMISDLTVSDALQLSFEFISDVAIDNGMGIEIPMAYQIMANRADYVSQTTHKYQSGIMFTYEELGDTLTSISKSAEDLIEVGLFPNPVSDNLTISFETSERSSVRVEVINTVGQTLISEILPESVEGNNLHSINTVDFESGLYILRLEIDGKNVSRKFLKE